MNSGPNQKVDLDTEALEFFFNSADKHFAVLNKDGTVRRANGAFRRFIAPAAGADNVKLSSYLVDECRDRFYKIIDEIEPNETVEDIKLTMRIGWNIRLVQASLSRSNADCYYFSAVDITNDARLEQRRKDTEVALVQLELLVGIGRWTISNSGPTFWSHGMFRMFGMDENAKLPTFTEYQKMMSKDDLQRMLDTFVNGRTSVSTKTVTCTINCPDGETRVIEFAGYPCYAEDGTVDGISGVALNKTNNLRELQSSMQMENSAKALFEYISKGIAVVDVSGNISIVNQSLTDMVGQSEAHILGAKVGQLWPQTPTVFEDSIAAALRGDITDLKYQRIERGLGEGEEDLWVNWVCAPWKGATGEICGAICIVKDVSESVLAKQETEASLARMEYGLSLSSMMVWEIDLLNKSVKIEGDWAPFFKTKPNLGELSNNLFKMSHSEDKQRVSKAWKQHLCAGAPVHMAYRKDNAAGREIWVSVASRQEADENGKPVRMIGSMRDITVSQKMDFMRDELEEHLEKKYQKKYSMIGEVARSVSQQISSMLGMSEAIKAISTNDEQIRFLKLMDTSAEMLSDTMENISKFVEIHASASKSSSMTFNAQKLVMDCAASFDEPAFIKAECGQGVDASYQGDSEKISVSLELCVRELKKSMGDNEHVIIETEIDDSGEGLCILSFDVKYSNPSIPYSDFILVELDKAEKEGMGMAIIHDFTEKLKGAVFYEKDGDRVSRILTEFPITHELLRTTSVARLTEVGDQQGLSILVAEDNPLNRRVLELLANKMNLSVSFVENGEEALSAVKTGAFDAVIMDTQMPILSGISAISSIREWEAVTSRSPIPIIAAIPNMSFSKVREAMAAGADDCISKPISQEDLVTHLSDLTSGEWELSAKDIAANG